MNNAEKFREVFGAYATEVWAKTEDEFLEWLNEEKSIRKQAVVKWSPDNEQWILTLWQSNIKGYEFSRAWDIKDYELKNTWDIKGKNKDDGYNFVCDSILCEIARLQGLGYEVKIKA